MLRPFAQPTVYKYEGAYYESEDNGSEIVLYTCQSGKHEIYRVIPKFSPAIV